MDLEKKTKYQLITEIRSLRRRLEEMEKEVASEQDSENGQKGCHDNKSEAAVHLSGLSHKKDLKMPTDTLDGAIEGIWILDSSFHTIFMNQYLADMLDMDAETIKGRPAEELFFEEENHILSTLRDRRLKGLSDHFEIKLKHRDGAPIWVTVSSFPIRDTNDRVIGVYAVLTNITNRKRHEGRLNRYRNKLEEMIEASTFELRLAKERLENEIVNRIQAERELRALNAQLIDEYEERKALSRKLIDMLEKDRLEVVSYLHDQVGQLLATLKMDLGKLIKQADRTNPGQTEAMTGIMDKLDQAGSLIRNISKDLRPVSLDRLGLVPSLRILLKEIISASSLEINFHHDNMPGHMKGNVALTVYRTVQEALNNILKYAKAAKVYVSLTLQGNSVNISVEDDGVGFDIDQWQRNFSAEGSFGLTLMRERIMQFEGEFTIESSPGKGTLIMAHIPLDCL